MGVADAVDRPAPDADLVDHLHGPLGEPAEEAPPLRRERHNQTTTVPRPAQRRAEQPGPAG
ncbi:hypothetical protein ACIRPK_36520 [Kitasatospora sp. NPDC101801]|uniref:hypothetical protein n=1 Tax=Kitasatospora sp. NPDC101801 TaxID=3364103 RepID=UPI0037F76F00